MICACSNGLSPTFALVSGIVCVVATQQPVHQGDTGQPPGPRFATPTPRIPLFLREPWRQPGAFDAGTDFDPSFPVTPEAVTNPDLELDGLRPERAAHSRVPEDASARFDSARLDWHVMRDPGRLQPESSSRARGARRAVRPAEPVDRRVRAGGGHAAAPARATSTSRDSPDFGGSRAFRASTSSGPSSSWPTARSWSGDHATGADRAGRGRRRVHRLPRERTVVRHGPLAPARHHARRHARHVGGEARPEPRWTRWASPTYAGHRSRLGRIRQCRMHRGVRQARSANCPGRILTNDAARSRTRPRVSPMAPAPRRLSRGRLTGTASTSTRARGHSF